MTLANRELFNKLKQLLPSEAPSENPPTPRWIQTNAIEKKWLKEAKFKVDLDLNFGSQSCLTLVFLDTKTYLLSVGLELNNLGEDFQEIPINAGLFCAAVQELNLQPIASDSIGLELYENVFTPVAPGGPGISYLLDSVNKFFPLVKIFEIKAESPLITPEPSLFRVALFAVTNCVGLITLQWTATGLENARAICSSQQKFLPFELVLRAVIERKNVHAFLELYRCIEFLFPFPKINQLRKKLSVELSTQELSEAVEDVLGWRPTEESALQKLFSALPDDVISSFRGALSLKNIEDEFLASKVATVLYKLRNDCVHFRPIQRTSTLQSSVIWELLLQTMLLAIPSLYASQVRVVEVVTPRSTVPPTTEELGSDFN